MNEPMEGTEKIHHIINNGCAHGEAEEEEKIKEDDVSSSAFLDELSLLATVLAHDDRAQKQ